MTNSDGSEQELKMAREPRPFLYLKAASQPLAETNLDPIGVQQLRARLQPQISMIVRCVVDYTIARHNVNTRRTQPISMSVLNRRRRAARALDVLESSLAAHLAAVQQMAPQQQVAAFSHR